MAETNSVQSVERTFALIELLCREGDMAITALSAASGLHKTTVFRLLNTLCTMGYVQKDARTERYGLTMRFLRISSRLLSHCDLRSLAHPYFEQLSHACGETVHLVRREENSIVYIDKVEFSESAVRMVSQIGLSLPLTCTAVGKAILARTTDEEIRRLWQDYPAEARTPHTITTLQRFMEEIQSIRQQGFAVDNEENEMGVRCIAAALPDLEGCYRYAFSVSAPISRMDDATLRQTARRVLDTQAAIIASMA